MAIVGKFLASLLIPAQIFASGYFANGQQVLPQRHSFFSTAAPPPPITFSNDHSMVFNGTNTDVDVGNVAPYTTFDYNTSACVSYWFKSSVLASGGIISKGFSSSSLVSWALISDNDSGGSPRISIHQDASHIFDKYVNHTYADGNWHNIVDSYDSSVPSLTVYVDGSSVAVSNNSTGTVSSSVKSSQHAIIGNWVGSAFYSGKLTQLAMWQGSTCSSSMATTIYNSGHPGDLTSLAPTVWYQFSTVMSPADSASGTIYDRGSGGDSANGTVQGTGSFSTDTP